MAESQDSGRSAPRNPDDIVATITGLIPVQCRVTPEPELEAVALDLRLKAGVAKHTRNLGIVQLLVGPTQAIDLATRLAAAAERVRLEMSYRAGEYPSGPEG